MTLEDVWYGLVFRDMDDNELNVAVFDKDKKTFIEVYGVDEDYNSEYNDLDLYEIVFIEFALNNPTVAGFKMLTSFMLESESEEFMTSSDFIRNCYDEENPKMIESVFENCTTASINRDLDPSLTDMRLDS